MILLHTARLELCEAQNSDSAFIFELLNSPSWLAKIGDREIRALSDAEAYIETALKSSYRQHGFGLLVVRLAESRRAIGLCGLLKRPVFDAADLGFAILPAFEGQGYMTEAGQAVLAWAREDLGLERVLAITGPLNKGSQRLLEKLGMDCRGETEYEGKAQLLYEWSGAIE